MGKQWKLSDYFLGLQNHCRWWCSHEIKRHWLLGRKVMTNLDSIFKSRDITLSTKVRLINAMVFPVVMYGCESWTIKRAEHQRTDVLNCGVGEDSWEFLGLQGYPTSPSWMKSVLNIHWKDWCWSWNSNTLATWCKKHLFQLIWKDPDAVKDWRQEEKRTTEDEMVGWHYRLDGHEFEQALCVGDGQGGLGSQSRTRLSDWTELLLSCLLDELTLLPL